jgi:hypothetical protein
LHTLLAPNLPCDISSAGKRGYGGRRLLFHHCCRLLPGNDLLDGCGEELGESACQDTNADLFERRQATPTISRIEPLLSHVRIRQEEQEAVGDALESFGHDTSIEGPGPTLPLVYLLDGVEKAIVVRVLVAGMQLALDLEARDDNVQRVCYEFGYNGA